MPISRVVDVRAELKMEVGMLKVRLISEGLVQTMGTAGSACLALDRRQIV
jgi:hypothetical protein